jgi:hypothetical protein
MMDGFDTARSSNETDRRRGIPSNYSVVVIFQCHCNWAGSAMPHRPPMPLLHHGVKRARGDLGRSQVFRYRPGTYTLLSRLQTFPYFMAASVNRTSGMPKLRISLVLWRRIAGSNLLVRTSARSGANRWGADQVQYLIWAGYKWATRIYEPRSLSFGELGPSGSGSIPVASTTE